MPFSRYNTLRICLVSLILSLPATFCNSLSATSNETLSSIKTVVIDPGHGGKDPGTVWSNGKYQEKNIVLQVALRLGEMIKSEYPGIKVLYTRSTDKYIGLYERSDFANRNKADIFISIHVNAAPKSPSASGTETFVMGTHKSESNFELCKTENSVIVLEEDYQSKYEGFDPNSPESYIIFSLLQNTHLEQSLKLAEFMQQEYKKGPVYTNRGVKQGGLIVLWRSTMPAVLTEIGFLSNAKDRNVLITKDGQRKIASNIFSAFKKYKEHFESGSVEIQTSLPNPPDDRNEDSSRYAASDEDTYYSVQILSVSKILKSNAPDLKGRKDYSYIKSNNAYKYMIGKYKTKDEAARALKVIRKTFNGAFIIKVSDGKIVL